MKNRANYILAILFILLLLIIGVSCCSSNSRSADDGEATTVPSTEAVTQSTTSDAGGSEPEAPPLGTDPPATKPVVPEVPETLPSEPEIPEAPPSEPATPSVKPSEPPKEENPEPDKPADPKPVEYIQGNGYKRVKDFDPATNTGERGFYINGEGIFYVYEDEYIFEVTPGTLTYKMWCSWDTHTQFSFKRFCDWSNATIDDKYNYRRITECDNYTCGWEDHYCYSDADHEDLLIEMARGCDYCGKKDCISFLAREETGFTATDIYSCPEYDAHKDPSRYCQHCGYRKWGEVIPGEIQCTRQMRYDQPCLYCDEMTYINQCHHCVVPEDYVPSKPGHFHVYNKQITAPTCTKPGVARYVCSCGDSSKGEEIPATEHQYGDWVVVKEATPEEWGIQEMKCSLCGKALSRSYAFCADNGDAEAIARLLIEYINDYRAEEGVGAATTMEQCTVYAKLRSEQMAAKGVAEHNIPDARAAATQLQYGTYVDPAEYGLPGDPYYHVNASEAVGMDGGTTVESVAAKFAEGFHNSAPHWSYVGSDPYIAVGMTMNSDGLWFCCIITSEENLDA